MANKETKNDVISESDTDSDTDKGNKNNSNDNIKKSKKNNESSEKNNETTKKNSRIKSIFKSKHKNNKDNKSQNTLENNDNDECHLNIKKDNVIRAIIDSYELKRNSYIGEFRSSNFKRKMFNLLSFVLLSVSTILTYLNIGNNVSEKSSYMYSMTSSILGSLNIMLFTHIFTANYNVKAYSTRIAGEEYNNLINDVLCKVEFNEDDPNLYNKLKLKTLLIENKCEHHIKTKI
jgi:hypothetical protein